MELCCIGVSHKTAPLAVRERLALPADRQREILQALIAAAPAGAEALLVSTCNRVEFYVVAEAPPALDGVTAAVREAIKSLAGEEALSHLYQHDRERALIHLFRVAASLDSMVVGEPQILGQVKDAFELSQHAGAAKGELARSCAAAFSAAKRVRSETGVGRAAVSMASAAVELAKKIFGALTGKQVLVVGAGEMAELSARHLASSGAARVVIANRTLAHAETLAATVGATAAPFTELEQLLLAADAVVSCTASPTAIFTRTLVSAVVKKRKHRPLFMVDLAVPRDIEPEVATLQGVYAYDVDDLQKVIAENAATRAAEAGKAEAIVAEEVARFVQARTQRERTPVLALLRKQAEKIAKAEVERTLQALGPTLNDKQRKSVEAMANAIVNKLLHAPTARLRAVSGNQVPPEVGERLADAAAELFGLGDDEPERPAPKRTSTPPAIAAAAAGEKR